MSEYRRIEPMKASDNLVSLTMEVTSKTVDKSAYLRELVQNSIEAGATDILIDIHWPTLEASGGRVYKLCVVDNGYGMTANELDHHLNYLGNSGKGMGASGNFGQGARVTTLWNNKAGVEYLSWKNGKGSRAKIVYSDGYPGMEYLTEADFIEDITDADEYNDAWPSIKDSGTIVVLHGNDDEQDTFVRPDDVMHWVLRYLQERYFSLPSGVTVRTRYLTTTTKGQWPTDRNQRNDATFHNFTRKVVPHRVTLDEMSESSGVVPVQGADIEWHILGSDEIAAVGRKSRYGITRAHCVAVHNGEMFDIKNMKGNKSTQEMFGITAGYKRFVIVARPHADAVQENQQRSHLIWLDTGNDLPWEEWGAQFMESMPPEVKDFINEEQEKAFSSRKTKTNNLLSDLMRMFGFARYQPYKSGSSNADGETNRRFGDHGRNGSSGENENMDNASSTLTAEKTKGIPARRRSPSLGDMPEIVGLSDSDEYDIDGAAHYVDNQNRIIVDYNYETIRRHIAMMEKQIGDTFTDTSAVNAAIRDAVRACVDFSLAQKVLSARKIFTQSPDSPWSYRDFSEEVSDRALTGALGNVFLFDQYGTKLAKEQYKKYAAQNRRDDKPATNL